MVSECFLEYVRLKKRQKNDLCDNNTLYFIRRNGTPPLFDVLPFEINNENYSLLIGINCTLFGNLQQSSVG